MSYMPLYVVRCTSLCLCFLWYHYVHTPTDAGLVDAGHSTVIWMWLASL